MTPQGFIQLHRCLLDWEWYQDINTKTLFIHCLLKANYQDKKWQGMNIERGSFITSLETLANEIGLTTKQIRTAIIKLERTGELAIKRTNRFSLVTVVKYSDFQTNYYEEGTQEGTQKALKGQTEGTQRATTNKLNKLNNINKDIYLGFVSEKMKKPFSDWLDYKKSKGQSYKNEKSMEACYKKLLDIADHDEDIAIKIIEQSIAFNYSGLFPLKQQNSYSKPKGTYNGFGGSYSNDIPL